MKKHRLLFVFLITLCFTSCVDIEERYDFNADGSCTVVNIFDMSKAVSVLMNLMTDSARATPEFAMAKDTTLDFYSALPDSTADKLNAKDAAMAKNSKLRINMDLNKDLMKITLSHTARNADSLKYYLEHFAKISSAGGANAISRNSKRTPVFDAQNILSGEDYYIYEISSNKFYRSVDISKFNAFLKKTASTFSMAKAMLIETPYKVVLNFAKPVKKLNNPKAVLSADRKRVTIQTDMNEVIKNPRLMDIRIDF
ncbi:hypothetical protein [Mucilaginibacter myungsuensis]|uniref:Uncharacterized protein n=1 Tax=Mucilaginibacter myungsuensis TaxID=649104 RepID=A0A929PUB2_9SPHI|nr:hypothetical protein [Mucilaginibacter myungsuensis]MBE9660558.1 hypothetical protein [Mucilaginibacter myungsuensis]MDN3600603.1 hypothetical protein [Mucilaginibacter myungsuensis]